MHFFVSISLLIIPEVVGAVVPNPVKVVPPNPVDADVVAVLKPPNAGADVAGAPKPTKQIEISIYSALHKDPHNFKR